MLSRKLTRRQAEILAYIDSLPYPPTYRQIGKRFGIKFTNSVAGHLKSLAAKGFLSRDACEARSLVVRSRRDGDKILVRGVWYRWIPAAELTADGVGNATRNEGEK